MVCAIGTFILTGTAAPGALVESFPIGQAMLDMKTLVRITENLLSGKFILLAYPSDIVMNASSKKKINTATLTLFFEQGPVGL